LKARIAERAVMRRLETLTEEEVVRWRDGLWLIAEEVIERYSDSLLKHATLLLSIIESVTPEHISSEMVKRKPEFSRYWVDETFYRRLKEETETLVGFLTDHRPGRFTA